MDLILWRHADAEEGLPDRTRQLTTKGEKQARDMAAWLRPRLPKNTRVLCSNAARAVQTATALTNQPEIMPWLGVGARPAAILDAAGWPDESVVVVVGHQPTLGQLASLLLAGEVQEWSFRKGSVWWISTRVHEGHDQNVLRAMMSPDML